MQQPIRVNLPRDLGMGLLPWINSQDIQLALDDSIIECRPISQASTIEWLHYSETLHYHRQLFFWRLYPLLCALSRTATPNATLHNPRLEIGN